jgi:hypothetical protein
LKGKYSLAITNDVIQFMMYGNDIDVAWNSDQKKVKKKKKNYFIDEDLVKVIVNEMRKKNISELSEGHTIEGYTRATTTTKDGNRVIFYAHPYFQGQKWYNWAYVHFEEVTTSGDAMENYYPSKIPWFYNNEWNTRSSNSVFRETINLV